MNEFKRYHPVVNFIYFVSVIGFSMFYMHPVCLFISLMCSFIYSVILKGRRALKLNLLYMLPVIILSTLFNPIFNHEGVTILAYFPNGSPLTFESLIYGFAAAAMISSVIFWFSCYNEIMTSDKFIYLFGRIIPSLSLVFSMTLRFVPRFTAQLKATANAQKCIGRDASDGSAVKRAKTGLSILSAMMTWALESSVTTAESMKSRGYGLAKRTAFSIFVFNKNDFLILLWIILSSVYLLAGSIANIMHFSYFPYIKSAGLSPIGISMVTVYLLLCMLPVIIETGRAIKWKSIKSKI